MKSKQTVFISTFNERTLNSSSKINELTYDAKNHNISIMAMQEHTRIHNEPIK